MSDPKRQTSQTSWTSTPSSTAANVELFLRTVRGKSELKHGSSPADAVLALLRSGPKSFPALMQESGLDFGDLDEALTKLEKRGLVVSEGEADSLRYRLTAAGEAIPAN